MSDKINFDSIEECLAESQQYSIERLLEILVSEEKPKAYIISENKPLQIEDLDNSEIIVEKNLDIKLLLYELSDGSYLVYKKKDDSEEGEEKNAKGTYATESGKDYELFVPTGVTVRRVPQNVLGNGVLGRAFIHSNYIEILDSLMGNEYTEVLTHEVYHILFPEKKEMEIRQMTMYTLGNATVYH
ncbi:MAG: hypothetical protein ABIJ34_07390 [archaeon]